MIAVLVLALCLGEPDVRLPAAERRIVHLSDGSCLRTSSRIVDGGLEVRAGDAWRSIDISSVTSSKLEREVVTQARVRLEAVAPTAYGLRVEAARWMIAEGLFEEATLELDRILRTRPDERHALALLDETRVCAALVGASPRIDLGVQRAPEESERAALLRAGARLVGFGSSPTKRELVVRALAATARSEKLDATSSTPTLNDDLARELEAGATTRRAFATLALRRIFPGRSLGLLAVHAVVDPALDVRDGAILALRDANNPAACGAVVRALAAPKALVRARAAEALGRMGYREAVEPLVQLMLAASPAPAGGGSGGPVRANLYSGLSTAYVRDYDLEIAQGASIANPVVDVLTSGLVFDVGVAGTSSLPITAEVWDAASALTRLTGQRFGTNASEWQKWWAANRDKYVPASRRNPRTGDN